MRSMHPVCELRRGKRWGFGGHIELLWVIAGLGLIISLVVPAIGYAMFTANKGMCKHKVKSLATVSKSLHTLDDSPTGGKWVQGFDWTAPDPTAPYDEGTYSTPVPDDNIKKSRLAFWRIIMDSEIRGPCGPPRGPQVFLCPGSAQPKECARTEIDGVPQRDFPDPRRNLFYSMFNQSAEVQDIVPNFGAKTGFIIMADRSPQDDGYALNANSGNHRWGATNTGQNLCYSSGEVEWADRTNVGINGDEIYARGNDVATPITKTTVPVDANDTILMPVAE